MFEGGIIDWIETFLENFQPNTANMVPPILRIILLGLKLLEKAKKNPLSQKCKENLVYPFFSTPDFLKKLKTVMINIEDPTIQNSTAKIINIFVPKKNVSGTLGSQYKDSQLGTMQDADNNS
mmetsp:Transcript_20392/g.17707  ORF Transcript_20392/g.17707 Transcript_20392/m.17707 type:complete len:122 (-) Transcript_20392:1434-1799(-)